MKFLLQIIVQYFAGLRGQTVLTWLPALAKCSGLALYQIWVMARVVPICSLGTHLTSILFLLTPPPVQQEERNNPPGAQVCPGHKQRELVNTALYDLEEKKKTCMWQILFQSLILVFYGICAF